MENKQDFNINSELFDDVRENLNKVLTSTVKNMISKQSEDGCVTLKIGITLKTQDVPNFGARGDEPKTRKATIPEFKYDCSSAIQIKSKTSGSINDEDELIYDPESDSYVLASLASEQRSIFDDDFNTPPQDEDLNTDEDEVNGHKLLGKPGMTIASIGDREEDDEDEVEEDDDFDFDSDSDEEEN